MRNPANKHQKYKINDFITSYLLRATVLNINTAFSLRIRKCKDKGMDKDKMANR